MAKTYEFYEDFSGDTNQWFDRGGGSPSSPECWEFKDGQGIFGIRQINGVMHVANVGTHFTFTYGVMEARMKFPARRKGAHGAVWLQTTEDYIPGQAEIDVAENFGTKKVWHNIYWREEGQGAEEFNQVKKYSTVSDREKFHDYKVIWEPDRYSFFVDGVKSTTIKKGLSDRPKMVVLSMLCDDWEQPDLTEPFKDYKIVVDWVRVAGTS